MTVFHTYTFGFFLFVENPKNVRQTSHDIAEILLKVALNTKNQIKSSVTLSRRHIRHWRAVIPTLNTSSITKINYFFWNHSFDMEDKCRWKQRNFKSLDISKPMSMTRSCLPVRQHHRCDESKMLPTTRLGIDLTDWN